MAASRKDIVIQTDSWTNVYEITGITVGSAIIVQNKDHGNVLLQICSACPGSSTDGVILPNFVSAYIDAGEPGVFVRACCSIAVINVQEQ